MTNIWAARALGTTNKAYAAAAATVTLFEWPLVGSGQEAERRGIFPLGTGPLTRPFAPAVRAAEFVRYLDALTVRI
jgi:hypothetical protein